MTATSTNAELATLARHRIAELELDLHRWRHVLALTQAPATEPTTAQGAPRRPADAPAVARIPPQEPRIITLVAARYGVTREQLLEHNRCQPATTARQVAMRLARELTRESYPTIGRAFRRDHATVIHACEATASFALGDLRDDLQAALTIGPGAELAARA